jgi:CHAT domain-containing protein
MTLFTRALAIGLLISSPVSARAQAGPPQTAQLETGKSIEREIRGGETHAYAVRIEAGQYVGVVVEQTGVDAGVAVYGPDGAKLADLDATTGTSGLELVDLVAAAAGTYRIEVRPRDPYAAIGQYRIGATGPRAATADDRRVVDAKGLLAEVSALSSAQKTDEAVAALDRLTAQLDGALAPGQPDRARRLYHLAHVYYGLDAYAKAEPLTARAVAAYEQTLGPDHPDVAAALVLLGTIHKEQRAYAKGEPLLLRAVAIREKTRGPEDVSVGDGLISLGDLYQAESEFAKAESAFARAIAVYEKARGAEHPDVATALGRLAHIYREQAAYAKAEQLFMRRLAILEKVYGPDHPEIGDVFNGLNTLYYNQNDLAKAEPLAVRALAIYEKARGPEHRDTARALNNLAATYHLQGKAALAEPLYLRALAIREKLLGPDHLRIAETTNNLAQFYLSQGDLAKAEPLMLRALAIWEKKLEPNHPNVGIGYANLAGVYHFQGRFDKAEEFILRSIASREKSIGLDHPDMAQSFNHLAVLRDLRGDVAGALEAQVRANNIEERDVARNLVSGSQQQKLLYLRRTGGNTHTTLTFQAALEPADPRGRRPALEQILRRKGRALDAMADVLGLLERTGSPEDKKLLSELAAARAALAGLTLAGPGAEGIAKHQAALAETDRLVADLEAQASARGSRIRVALAPITFDAVAKAVPKGSVLVEFAYYTPFDSKTRKYKEGHYVVYTLSDAGAVGWADLGPSAKVNGAIADLRRSLGDTKNYTEEEVRERARELDELVMRPVRALVGSSTRLLVAPEGAINLVPFAALVDDENRYLVERYEISYLTSGRDLLRLRERDASLQPPLVMAAPDFGPAPAGSTDVRRIGIVEPKPAAGATAPAAPAAPAPPAALLARAYFSPLSGTRAEASALSKLLPKARVLTGVDATKAALVGSKSPRVLHVATHGFFFDAASQQNPLLRSGLALAGANLHKDGDGIVTAEEVAGLDLWGTQLVVLSACDTGLGEIKTGDGVYGLRRALVLAGAETQMMSLWAVSDTGTSDLMVGYYRALMAGRGRSQALREVQLEMLKDRNRRSPYFWASFIVSGAWEPLTTQNRSR